MPRTCKDAVPDDMFKAELEEPDKVTTKPDARTDVRTDLRDEIREKLAASTGKTYIGLHWATKKFADYIVRGEGRVIKGWPRTVPFGDPSYIPGGEKRLQRVLDMWRSGAIRWEKATEDDLTRAVLDPVSVLPSTPLPPRKPPTPKERAPAKYVTGQLVMHRVNLAVVARPIDIDDEEPPAKRRRVSGQRVDTNKARLRLKGSKPRNPKVGVKTPRFVRDDDALPHGFSALDTDLGRLWEAGEVEVS